MRRRDVLLGALSTSVCALSVPLGAQPVSRARLGWLSGGVRPEDTRESLVAVLKEELQKSGWRIGETLEIDERQASGDALLLPRLAADIVAQRPHVIACTGGTEAKALQEATRDIPIVFMQVAADPVATGLVESISRPGGNVTGFLQSPQNLSGKRLDILTELLGRRPRRLAYVVNPGNVNTARLWADAAEAAGKLGAEIQRAELRAATELAKTFTALRDRDAAIVQYDFLLIGLRDQIAELARRQQLPVIYENRAHVAVGGLISYGPDLRENYRQGAAYIDRILRGVHPRDLPIVQSSQFELVLNSSAAKTLKLTIPPTLLARADEVIE